MKQQLITISFKIPQNMDEDIKKELSDSYYNNRTEFIKTAIIEKLRKMSK